MENELDLNNILSANDAKKAFMDMDDDFYIEEDALLPEDMEDDSVSDNEEETKNKTTETREASDDAEESESVGSEESEDTDEESDLSSGEGQSTSPTLYSSIAKALKGERVFPDLEDSYIDNIKTPEDFNNMIEEQVQQRLDATYKRIDEALGYGVSPSEVSTYEQTLKSLKGVTSDSLRDESEQGEKLRKSLIYNDYINRGYSKERAEREIKKSFDSGSDIEDAEEAYRSIVDYYETSYKKAVSNAKKEQEKAAADREERIASFKNSIMKDKSLFADVDIDTKTRQKIIDNIYKPSHKDSEGNYLSAIQKYERENPIDFVKNIGILFTLTDGFSNMENLFKGKVKKEVRKGFKELEATLSNSMSTSGGNLKYASGVSSDTDSVLNGNWDLDL